MHPFLPLTSLTFLLMSGAFATYLRVFVRVDPILMGHQSSFAVPMGISLVFGAGLAYWLRGYKIQWPFWFSIITIGYEITLFWFTK